MSITTLTTTLVELQAIGGRRWTAYGKDRLYFEAADLYGLKYETYKTGNIMSTWLNGERISNYQGKRILATLSGTKVFVDCGDLTFHVTGSSDADQYARYLKAVTDRLAEHRAAKQAA